VTIDRGDGVPRRPGVVAVARAVGVSPSTVSNAFNRPERLSPALRERVLRAAAELGYGGPDPVARSLRSGRAAAIGVVFRRSLADAFEEPATVQLLKGLSDVTDPQQLALVLVPGLRQEHPSIGPAVRNAAVDGLIVYSMSADDPLFEAARRRRLPMVIVDSPAGTGPDFVGIDDGAAAEAAVSHLLELGHRSLAILSFGLTAHSHPGPADIRYQAQAIASVPKARLEGSRRAIAAAGLDWASVPVEQVPITSAEGCLAGAHALLDRAPGTTALFAFSDPLALAARLAARERGLSVPRDLSIIGFDDTAPASEGLTTIHQPLRDKGRIAAERLLGALSQEPSPPGTELLPTRLVVRGSTAPPRTG
jgi:DNA-binding LacI/PurR family transcriptional regulator